MIIIYAKYMCDRCGKVEELQIDWDYNYYLEREVEPWWPTGWDQDIFPQMKYPHDTNCEIATGKKAYQLLCPECIEWHRKRGEANDGSSVPGL